MSEIENASPLERSAMIIGVRHLADSHLSTEDLIRILEKRFRGEYGNWQEYPVAIESLRKFWDEHQKGETGLDDGPYLPGHEPRKRTTPQCNGSGRAKEDN